MFIQYNAGIQCGIKILPTKLNLLLKNTDKLEKNSWHLIKNNQDILNQYLHIIITFYH